MRVGMDRKDDRDVMRAAIAAIASAMAFIPSPKFSRRCEVTATIRLPAKRSTSGSSPDASEGSSSIRALVASSASITVFPVMWMRSAGTFSARSAFAAVCVGAKCRSATAPVDLAIHLLGPRMIDIAAAQPRFDMADGNFAEIGGERGSHGGQRVAVDEDAVGLFGVESLANSRYKPREQSVE
jgi:hypothetical protein